MGTGAGGQRGAADRLALPGLGTVGFVFSLIRRGVGAHVTDWWINGSQGSVRWTMQRRNASEERTVACALRFQLGGADFSGRPVGGLCLDR